MATVSVNQGIKISGAVSAAQNQYSNGTVTLYTVPANSYVIFSFSCDVYTTSDKALLKIGGQAMAQINLLTSGTPTSPQSYQLNAPTIVTNLYAGPGQTIEVTATVGVGGQVNSRIAGVLFTNF